MYTNFIPNYTSDKNVNVINRMYEKNVNTFKLTTAYQEIIGAILGKCHNMSIESREDAMAAYFGIKHTLLIPTQGETDKVFKWVRTSFAPNMEAIATTLELAHYNSVVNFFCNKTFEKWVERYETDANSYDQPLNLDIDLTDYVHIMNNKKGGVYGISYKLFSLKQRGSDHNIGVATECETNFILKNPIEDFSFIPKKGIIVNSKSLQHGPNVFDIDSLLNATVGRIGIAVISIYRLDCKKLLPHIICII
jgi:hypothetical protein